MKLNLTSLSESLMKSSLIAALFLFPLFFLPTTVNFFETNKLALLIVISSIALVAYAIDIIATKQIRLTLTPFSTPLLLVAASSIISSIWGAQNSFESFTGRGALIPALALLGFLAVNTIKTKKFLYYALYTLIASGTILAFIAIFQSLGVGLSTLLNQTLNLHIPDTLAFTPAGSPLALISFVAPMTILSLFLAFTRRDSLEKVVLFILSAIMTSSLVLSVLFTLPGKDNTPVFLKPQTGYAIAMEVLKNTDTALLGYGPEHFVNAFNRHRPVAHNLSDYWNVRFTNSSNELFHLIATQGFLGLVSWSILAVVILKSFKNHKLGTVGRAIKVVTAGLLLMLILIPASYLHLFALFMMLTIWSLLLKFKEHPSVRQLTGNLQSVSIVRPDSEGQIQNTLPVLPYLVALPIFAAAVGLFYYTGRAYAAEMTFKQSLDAAAQNDGLKTYNLQNQTIRQMPYLSRYRRAYSATNLALANSLSAKENITDQDRANITQLIQQSIREAKAAVTLDPQNIANWENLITVYKSLINVAQNADQWTIASIAQAIRNEPTNPRLRLELGGIYYSLGNYDQAIRFYQQAAELKPDWANAYYNLSNVYQAKKEYPQAFDYMRQVLSLVKPDSADYTKAQEKLEELSKLLNLQDPKAKVEQVPEAQTELNTPAPLPTPNPNDSVQLPANSGPDSVVDQNQPAVDNLDDVDTPTPSQNATPSPAQP